ncbi:SCO family protein [Cytophagales bacterium LB-30]|uniref:SCO family protein n=1 Tax=Shiella aurantiaca TaxID=3058365 RepID=A0ABT8F7V5_9BACT|nr:SCO family protein [Shiella aurantiaca]MDN4166301.1 SCO family protein [Shiella aurantiaca]
MKKQLLILSFVMSLLACESREAKLPILGNRTTQTEVVNGKLVTDTIYHTIPPFILVDQDSATITEANMNGHITISDFFFTSCPTICPIMKTQMLRVYQAFENDSSILILSHSIDSEHDTVALLRDFAERLDVSSKRWHFLTGPQEDIFELGEKGYIVTTQSDPDAPGGYLHSGAFILVDDQRRIRGIYDGTEPEQVDQLIKDIPRLKKELGL